MDETMKETKETKTNKINNGFCHNIDGSLSDRLIWITIIIIISLTIIFIWSFGKDPKPEYAFKLLSQYISIVLPLLIGGQTAENYFRNKNNEDNIIKNNKDKNIINNE
jgi:hypothetical protein